VARCSYSWNVAASYRGGIQLQTGVRNPVYDQQTLRELLLALQNGDILVEIEGGPVPAAFWRSEWSFEADGERLLSFVNSVTTPEGVAPHLVVPQASEGLDPPVPAQTTPRSGAASSAQKPGPKPGVSGKVRVAELADEVLRDKNIHIPEGRGRTTRLAELIHKRLTNEGHNYRLESVQRTLRDPKDK